MEDEYVQLPPGAAGVVVIDMSRTSVGQVPEKWAKIIDESFGEGLYSRLSAVWLRSGHPTPGEVWKEWFLVNRHASVELPIDIANRLIPGLKPADLG